jgi:3-oxoacyl-[acyl-carrier-protein] synthase-3
VGLNGVVGVLPPKQLALKELAVSGVLSSTPQVLSAIGFERAHVCDPAHRPEDLVVEAATMALKEANLQPGDVDLLIWAGARPESHVRPASLMAAPSAAVMQGFRYNSAWLQNTLDLHGAEVVGVAQQGCATMFSALRVARALLLAEPGREHALCVGLDVLAAGAHREILYNVISDAACAVVVSRGCARERWLGYRQLSRGYYWDPCARGPQIIAGYFPTAKAVIQQLLAEHALRPSDVDIVVPTGVSRTSWNILLRLIGIPQNRLHLGEVESFGHTITSDSFIYLQDLRRHQISPGSRILLFTFGFGSTWCALLLEH